MKKQLIIAAIGLCLSAPVLADNHYEYCKYKFVVSNGSDVKIRASEGWIWPVATQVELNPYENKSKCMIFGQVTSVKFEYYDEEAGGYKRIPGCPQDFFALHSIKVNVKSRRDSPIPYCKYVS